MIQLRPYQNDAVESIFEYFDKHGGTDKDGFPIEANPIVAMQTGLGKSLVLADFFKRALQQFPQTRGIMATHLYTLINQNHQKIKDIWPQAPIGVYSAGLGKKQNFQPIIYGGIRSMVGKFPIFGYRDILCVDECFSPDTEILTENGFIAFDKLQTEKVAQYNSSTQAISFVNPIRYVKKKASEGLISVKTEKSFDLLVTPNHEMLIKDSWKNCYFKKKAKDVTRSQQYKMPVAGFAVGQDFHLQPWEKFAICYQADGSLHQQNSLGIICAFSFSKQRKIDEFLKLMKECKYNFKEVSAKASVNENVKARRRFMVYLSGYVDKTINDYFNLQTMSLEKARSIIEYMNLWDGHVATKAVYLYTTTNKKMADFYQAVATLAGHRTNLTLVVDNRKETFSDCYRLFINLDKVEVDTQVWRPVNVPYEGDVYCVEVPDGNIITRHGGKVIITGNCHLISPESEGSYIKLIWELRYGEYVKAGEQPTFEQFQKAKANPNCNPYLKVVGFSATPFRQGLGMLTNGPIFTDFCYNNCTIQGWTRMLAEGYLAPLYPRPTQTTLDVNGIKVTNGEFNQHDLQARVDKKDVTSRCLLELLQHAHNRKCGLIFASGIEHAEHIAEIMNDNLDQECVIVHSGNKEYPRTKTQNDEALKLWKDGKVKWAINVNSLTTGIDKPELDIIANLRPTLSSVLHIQMLGRGTRPASGKHDCVVLDFAGNVPRLGPVDDPKIPKVKSGIEGDMPVKICGQCGTYNHARATECIACECPFPINSKLSSIPSAQPLLRSEMPIVESFNVLRAIYQPYVSKATQRNMIKVAYYCDRLKTFFEFVTVERKQGTDKYDYAAKRGRDWYRARFGEPPLTNTEVLAMSGMLKTPAKINVWVNKSPAEILSCEF